MKLLFGLIGALLGVAAGIPGAIAGALFGLVAAVMWDLARDKPAKTAAEPAARPAQFQAPMAAASVAEALTRRVQKLEQDVLALQTQIRTLSANPAAQAASVAPALRSDVDTASGTAAVDSPILDSATTATPPLVMSPLAPPQAIAQPPAPAAASLDGMANARASVQVDSDAASAAASSPPPAATAGTPIEFIVEPRPTLLVNERVDTPMSDTATPSATSAAPASPAPSSTASVAACAPAAAQTPSNPPQPAWPAAAPARPRPPAPPPPPPVPLQDRLPSFVSRFIFGSNTIVKAGVLILFLGLAFLLRYTAQFVTVSIQVRYAGVALVGVALLGLGWRLRKRPDAYGLILQGAGTGVFYLTVLGATELNHLLPPTFAFAAMALVALFGAVLAVMQDAPWLALVAVAEGFAAPMLIRTGSTAYGGLFTYMAILDLGIFAMSWFRAWRPLNLVGAVATFSLASGWAQLHYAPDDYAGVQAFLLFFFVLFTSVGLLFARRALAAGDAPSPTRTLPERAVEALRRVGRVDSTLTFGVPLAAFTLQYLLVRDMPMGPAWAAFGFALFHILLGGTLLRGRNARYSLLGEAHVVVGVIFGTLAIPLALDGVWNGATWAVEAAGMYWLGARQRRPYARAFAMLVMGGAAVQLLHGLGFDNRPDTPLLTGSTLGLAMLVVALCAIDLVRRRIPEEERGAIESLNAGVLPFAAATAIAALPWMLLTPMWASATSAWLAFGCAALQGRLAAPVLRVNAVMLHVAALSALALSLHASDGGAALADGWRGLTAAVLIGVALLATGWMGIRASWNAAVDGEPAPASLAGSVGLIAGLAVVSGSLLFVLSADRAALAWPWIGVVTLWIGIRLRQVALALSAAALQVAAAVVALGDGSLTWPVGTHANLALNLTLTLAAFVGGDLLRRADASASGRRYPAWWHGVRLQWVAVAWGLFCWTQTLPPALYDALDARHTLAAWPHWLNGWLTLTSAALLVIGRWRQWRVVELTTLVTVPLWIVLALWPAIDGMSVAPSADFGWLAWPLALAWHLVLLRQQARWKPAIPTSPLHVAGFWLFAALATRECVVRLHDVGTPGSAWATLALMLVPALLLVAITRPFALRRWPVAAFAQDYLLVGCAPLALYLFGWLWFGNTTAGDAAPLPYVPVLNPLEIGQGLSLMSLAAWARALPASTRERLPRNSFLAGLGVTAFALVTGLVLRTCHHGAGVAWNEEALYASTLTQAALSVAWALIGVALMLTGHRRVRRVVWIVGAALLGLVVAKLFLVELANHGSLYRIVSFIVVGVLLLIVGYFAPMPPAHGATRDAAPRDPTPDDGPGPAAAPNDPKESP